MKIYKNSEKIFKISLLLIGVAVIFSFGINSSSAVVTPSIYVNTHGNNNWDGQLATWNGTSGPKATIKNATGTIASGGTVHIASGTYKENNININKNMNVIGENQKNTIINGTNTGPIFNIISGVKVTLINLTLTNGTASNGGVIYNLGTLNIIDSTFTNNKATNGGAIYNDHILTVNNSTFTKNTASNCGGAIYNDYTNKNTGTLTVSGTTFTGNNANYGGAIGAISHFGTLTLTGTTFTGNNATWGGAIYNDDVLTVKSSTFTGNTAKGGGAIYNEGIANVHFSRIVKNIAKSQGSAIYNDFGTANVSLNWWGSNANPSNNVYGTKVPSWLVLTVKANPKILPNNSHSTITADLLHDNLGNSVSGYVTNGIPVTFTTTLGTIISKSSIINGIAKSTLKSGSKAGVATISAKLDNQTVKTSVTIKDTILPKVSSTIPINLKTGVSRTSTIVIKFSENIKTSTYYSNIKVKNLTTGKYVTITKTISGNTFYIKMTSTRLANNWYQVIIPAKAIKDIAGNNLLATYTFKFKTRS